MTDGTVPGMRIRRSSRRHAQYSREQQYHSIHHVSAVNQRHKRRYGLRSAIIDIIGIGLSLLIFALFHHVIPHTIRPAVPAATTVPAAETVETVSGDGAETVAAEPAAADFSDRFADKFTDGEILTGENTYQSPNLNIRVKQVYQNGAQAYVADIYIRNLSCLNTAFAWDSYGRNTVESTEAMAQEHNAILAINGDYYGVHTKGLVIRNETVYRDTIMKDRDVCVIYNDGSMKTFDAGTFDLSEQDVTDIMQAWNFGPALLDSNGQPKVDFEADSDITPANPRSAIGYIEPGHYCFVAVDGRSNVSAGWDLPTLSQFMYSLGCRSAYNLDGGKSSVFVVMGKTFNVPAGGGRKISDIVMITDGGDTVGTVTTY